MAAHPKGRGRRFLQWTDPGRHCRLGHWFLYLCGKSYDALTAFGISSCIGLSLVLAMFISSLVGTVVPMGFKKIHIDPAVASGPLITTVTDLVGVVTYYTLAWAMLVHGLGL